MAQFTVDRNLKVVITSSINAAYKQMFIVERQLNSKPGWWEGMGKRTYNGGDSDVFAPFSETTTWRITCKNDQGHGNWVTSRERLEGPGTPSITINCDDDTSGDGDFNDLIVRVQLGYGSSSGAGIVPVDNVDLNKIEEKNGDGNFKQDKEQKDPPTHNSGKKIDD